jgi:integrase/recombinase XerC
MRIDKAIESFQTQLRADGRSPHTVAAYIRELRLFARWIGKQKRIETITPTDVAGFFTSDAALTTTDDRPRSTISTNRLKSTIRVFFNFQCEAGLIDGNPARLVKSKPCHRKTPATLSDSERRALLDTIAKSTDALARRDFTIVSLLLGTGIRLASLVGLDVSDLDFKEGTINITSKGGRTDTVIINVALRRVLSSHFKAHEIGGASPLFQTSGGKRLCARQVQYRISQWIKQAGITHRASVHTLRHTFATRLYRMTGDLRLVQRALGHRQVTTTEIYTHLADDSLKKAIRFI